MLQEKSYESRINELQARLEDLNDFIENASIPLHWVNEDGIITWANKAELDALGYSKEEYIGQPIKKFHADEKVIEDILKRLINNESLHNYAAILKCKSGELKHVLINSNVRRKDGKFLHTRCFTRDVSELVSHSEKREALLKELEQKNKEIAENEKRLDAEVKKRTEELVELNHLLEQKNEQLNANNTELKAFNYMAGHDLQEPLRKILTFSSLTRANIGQPEKATRYLDKIISSAQSLQDLMQSLLEYSKVSTSKDDFVETDLNGILSEVKELLSEKIAEKKVRIISDQLPTLPVIPFQFQQLFSNLIGNSIKYSKPDAQSEIKITMKKANGKDIPFSEADRSLVYWNLDFADNGIGFKQEYAGQIFDLFKRLHSRDVYGGTGVGLGICKRIVENHKGFIKAKGNENEGAVFSVFLPESRSSKNS